MIKQLKLYKPKDLFDWMSFWKRNFESIKRRNILRKEIKLKFEKKIWDIFIKGVK